MVSDAQIAKTLGMCVRAAVNAAHDLDPEKSARIVRVHLELSETSGNMSRLHIQTVGELGTKAKANWYFSEPRRIPRGTRVASSSYLFDCGCSLRNSG